jgi:hypothetical protein
VRMRNDHPLTVDDILCRRIDNPMSGSGVLNHILESDQNPEVW